MKKILYLLLMTSIVSVAVMADVTVQEVSEGTTTSSTVITNTQYLRTTFVNQNPYPADPGSYVDVLFQIENIGTKSAENVTVEIVPQYPFSLDTGVSAINNIGRIAGLQTGNNAFQVKYHLRVDNNAIDGDNEIKLKYSVGDGSAYKITTFNISVSNPRTDFDVVAQDSTTLAIANIGSNTASSVIVSIPEQEDFRVSGASSSIIGNLNAGDYTLATFQITQNMPMTNVSTRNFTRGTTNNNLTVDISYTDTLGIRRTVEKNVPFAFISSNITGQIITRTEGFSSSNNGILYIAIGVVGIVVVVVFIRYRSRKRK